MWLDASIFMMYGPPAGVGGKVIFQVRSALDIVRYFFPAKLIVIFSPGEAQPHILTGPSRCKIMLSRTSFGKVTCAFTTDAMLQNSNPSKKTIAFDLCSLLHFIQ